MQSLSRIQFIVAYVDSVWTGSESVSYIVPTIWELIPSELTQKKFITYGADFM